MNTIEVTKLLDTVLAIPGMSETVKVNLNVNRKQVLILAQAIEKGINENSGQTFLLLQNLETEMANAIQGIVLELLHKAGLSELYDKLKELTLK